MKTLKKFLRKSLAVLLIIVLAVIVFPAAILGMFYEVITDAFFKGGHHFSERLCELIDDLLATD